MMTSDIIALRALEINYCAVILGIVQNVITFGKDISVDAILKGNF